MLGFVIALLLAATPERDLDGVYRNITNQGIQVRMLLFVAVIGLANWFWWRLRANQRAQLAAEQQKEREKRSKRAEVPAS